MKKILMLILIIIFIFTLYLSYDYFTRDKYITSDEAKEIAMNDVSNKTGEYIFNSISYNETNDTYVYTLEFSDNVNYYTYKINAKTKKIISSKKEYIDNNKKYINEEKILDIVFNHANLNKINCNIIANTVVLEENTPIYNTVFYNNNIKYTYKINAYTGSIISVTKLNENAV